jgi:hypothetical protein
VYVHREEEEEAAAEADGVIQHQKATKERGRRRIEHWVSLFPLI